MFLRTISGFSVQFLKNIPTRLQHTSVSFENGIKYITMSDDKTRNSLSIDMMKTLICDITDNEDDKDLRVIVIGAKGAVFSAGHNLKELTADKGMKQQETVFKLAGELMSSIINSPVPVIARVDGLAAAAGCQLVAQCDLAFCTEKSTFSTPGANFGLFCSTPGVALARSVPKTVALKMLLTGFPISGRQAESYGLITQVCQNLDEEILKVCDAIKAKSRDVITLGKDAFYKQIDKDIGAAYELCSVEMVRNLQLIDGQEGLKSFVEKRKPRWS